MKSPYFYIITGGPGVGKTSLIEELNRQGFSTVSEDARRIIKEQVGLGEDGVPWKNKVKYAQLMREESISSYERVMKDIDSSIYFFDRGLLDAICYMRMQKITISTHMLDQIAKCRYANPVFVLPPWPEIYQKDTERKQDWKEAKSTFAQMKETYVAFGYQVIELPKSSVTDRAEFILNHIGQHIK